MMLLAAAPLSSQHVLSAWLFVARLAVGALLGIIIGLERQRRQSAAGVHTSSLVATGATLFAMIPALLGDTANATRMLANIVTGIGFLAGGVILKEGTNVRGLNTAATLWATAAVGALAGVGLYPEATLSALVIVTLNVSLEPLVRVINMRSRRSRDAATIYDLAVKARDSASHAVREAIIGAVSDSVLTLRSMSASPGEGDALTIEARLQAPGADDGLIESVVKRLATIPGVNATSWTSKEEDG